MSTRDRTLFKATIQSLNWIFWFASIALWLWIVIRSGIWSAGVASDIFWIKFFTLSGCGNWNGSDNSFCSQRVAAIARGDGHNGTKR
jgi:hypothetical protein